MIGKLVVRLHGALAILGIRDTRVGELRVNVGLNVFEGFQGGLDWRSPSAQPAQELPEWSGQCRSSLSCKEEAAVIGGRCRLAGPAPQGNKWLCPHSRQAVGMQGKLRGALGSPGRW